MKSIFEKYNSWIKDFLEPRYPELVPPIKAALTAYDRLRKKQQVNINDLQPIIDIAHSSHTALYLNGATLLGDLAAKHREARRAIEEMSIDTRARIRNNAIIALAGDAPRDFSLNIIQRLMTDKSASVRERAADYALRLYLPEAIPDIEQALSIEIHDKTRRTLEFSLQKLREGESIKTKPA